MKKICSLILSLTLIFGCCLALSSCGEASDAPEGMKLCRGSDSLGYYFYIPEEWTVANDGNIAAAYVSKADTTSVSFAEAEKPSEENIKDYFNNEKTRFPFDIKVTVEGEKVNFGNADKAYKFVYNYEYKEYKFNCMQIYVYSGDRFFIFTYNSYDVQRSEGETYYQFYLTKVEKILESFKFTEQKPQEDKEPEYVTDEDGYKLISDRALANLDFYVPMDYKVTSSSAIVSATREDGTTLSISEATDVNVSFDEYYKSRKEELSNFATDIVDIEISKLVELDGAKGYSYEYKYTLGTKTYHVYQALVIAGMRGYVYTYTATEDNYNLHLDEAMKVLSKIGF